MKHLVIIPCYNRDGFLRVCLKHIEAAYRFKDHTYLFAIDRGNSAIYSNVIRPWEKYHGINVIAHLSPFHQHIGNVYNFMHAFKHAASFKFDIVHVIEDDVFIAHDYFYWHEKAWDHANKDTFAVSACRNQNLNYQATSTSNTFSNPALIYRHTSYQSLGVSLSRKTLNEILPHCKPEYWNAPSKYIMRHFSYIKSIPASVSEQAGLLHRLLLRSGSHTIYPLIEPRAYHAGFAGKNRPANKPAHEYTAYEIELMTEQDMNREAIKHKDIAACDTTGFFSDNLILVE